MSDPCGGDPFAKMKGFVENMIAKLVKEAQVKDGELMEDIVWIASSFDHTADMFVQVNEDFKTLQHETAALAKVQAEKDQILKYVRIDRSEVESEMAEVTKGGQKVGQPFYPQFSDSQTGIAPPTLIAQHTMAAIPNVHEKDMDTFHWHMVIKLHRSRDCAGSQSHGDRLQQHVVGKHVVQLCHNIKLACVNPICYHMDYYMNQHKVEEQCAHTKPALLECQKFQKYSYCMLEFAEGLSIRGCCGEALGRCGGPQLCSLLLGHYPVTLVFSKSDKGVEEELFLIAVQDRCNDEAVTITTEVTFCEESC